MFTTAEKINMAGVLSETMQVKTQWNSIFTTKGKKRVNIESRNNVFKNRLIKYMQTGS